MIVNRFWTTALVTNVILQKYRDVIVFSFFQRFFGFFTITGRLYEKELNGIFLWYGGPQGTPPHSVKPGGKNAQIFHLIMSGNWFKFIINLNYFVFFSKFFGIKCLPGNTLTATALSNRPPSQSPLWVSKTSESEHNNPRLRKMLNFKLFCASWWQ